MGINRVKITVYLTIALLAISLVVLSGSAAGKTTSASASPTRHCLKFKQRSAKKYRACMRVSRHRP